ncbi:myozenin-1a [Nerophis ophidion]|uniref:myozenin-1a n=1 Tax=Nerophis ophidion TaxID=159077 RepID=UPI002ADFE961|nr:myozenin-1a [Nerophis ophidion]
MPVRTPAPLIKRRKPTKVIIDLSKISQDEYEIVPNISEFDLGRKIGVPKDIMLEELSLLKNKGSKMFKMRQQRVEKFIYENNPDIFIGDTNDEMQGFVPSLGGHMGSQTINLGGYLLSKDVGQLHYGMFRYGGSGGPVPLPKPGSQGGAAGGAGGAGGAVGAGEHGEGQHGKDGKGDGSSEGSPLKDGGKGDASKKMHGTSYTSPWEKAMKGDAGLIATLKSAMPGPCKQIELRKYKSFNRSAMPYGGYEKASQFMKFQLPDSVKIQLMAEPLMVYENDLNLRPSFNRTPIGWMGSSEPCSIHVEVPYEGETDEL